ncbi:MAG TPA: hypothetical protein VK780_08790 [Thermoanaerobaculia bacterium]|nr:hypothetical protein [Thermoanaerobaculia bacterium]
MPDRRLRPGFRLLLLLVSAAVACSDRTPTTSPLPMQAGASAESGSSRGPSKNPATRAIDSRGGALPSLQGVWGGDRIGLTITAYGAAVEYDCAAGSIDQVFAPDASGHFDLIGSWWFTPPVLSQDWVPDKRPARYIGVLEGKTITLTVIRLDDGSTLSYRLAQDAVPRILHCL